MSRVELTRRALRDVEEIYEHIATDNVTAAERWADRFDDRCKQLAELPRMGRERIELRPGLRSFPLGDYLLFYRPLANGIRVIRVLHGRRRLERFFR